jgi:hypothetical protein
MTSDCGRDIKLNQGPQCDFIGFLKKFIGEEYYLPLLARYDCFHSIVRVMGHAFLICLGITKLSGYMLL